MVNFLKPSELWTDNDPDLAAAESTKTAFRDFKFPVLQLGEKNAEGKVIPFNVFERSLQIIMKDLGVKQVLKTQGYVDLDTVFMNIQHPQIAKWRDYTPTGKTLSIKQMFPNPFLGRKLYYGFVMMENEKEWYETTEPKKDEKGNELKDKEGKTIMKRQTRDVIKEDNTPSLKLGGVEYNDKKTKGSFIYYQNTWKNTQIVYKNDAEDNPIPINANNEFEFNQVKSYCDSTEILKNIGLTDQLLAEYNKKNNKNIDKVYCFILTSEIKYNKNAFYKYSCTVDHIEFT